MEQKAHACGKSMDTGQIRPPPTGFLFSVLPLVEIEDHPAASQVLSTDVDLDFLRGDE
jgi:hypothetical protein